MNVDHYIDLSKLLFETRKIESALDNLGGEGKGLWEKADSIKHKLPNDFPNKIFCMALVRNRAMHGSPKIDNIDNIVLEANVIQERLKINKILNILKTYDISHVRDKRLDDFIEWTVKMKLIKGVTGENKEVIRSLITDSQKVLNNITGLMKDLQYKKKIAVKSKQLTNNIFYIASVMIVMYIIWSKGF
jgi:hypothetical protein